MTSTDTNEELVRQYYEAFNEGDIDQMRAYIDEEIVNHDPLSDETLALEETSGDEDFVHHIEAAWSAFPGATVTIHDLVAENDLVAVRLTFEGTNDGFFAGYEPTGRPVSSETMVFMRCADGKIVERWAASDNLDLLQQLGILGPTEELAPIKA